MQLEATLESFVLVKFGQIQSGILYKHLMRWLESERRAIEKSLEASIFLENENAIDTAWELVKSEKREEIESVLSKSEEKTDELEGIPF